MRTASPRLRNLRSLALLFLAAGTGSGCGLLGGSEGTSAALSELTVAEAISFSPEFHGFIASYAVGVGPTVESVEVTATAEDEDAVIEIDGTETPSGTPSDPIPLTGAVTPVDVLVTSADGQNSFRYLLVVTKNDEPTVVILLKAPYPDEGDHFGNSLAASGDLLVVGAPNEDSAATGIDGDGSDNSAESSGAAYVYALTSTGWVLEAYLKASNAEANDNFGQIVAISGETVVVTAPGESSAATGVDGDESDNSAPWAGAVYVFERIDGVWVQTAYVKASNTDADDGFGAGVAIAGDTLVVGAPGESSGASGVDGDESDNSLEGAGAAYVYARDGGTWSQVAYLKASNPGGDGFGGSVALGDDIIVVAALYERTRGQGIDPPPNDFAGNSGAAYVFALGDQGWEQEAFVKTSNSTENQYFTLGPSLSASGLSFAAGAVGDGSAATGINGDDTDQSAEHSGAAFVWFRDSGAWTQEAYVKASNNDEWDEFGTSTSIVGDALLVGSWSEDGSGSGVNADETSNGIPESGAAYLYVRTAGAWQKIAYLKPIDPAEGELFGYSVVIGGSFIAVGALAQPGGEGGIDADPTSRTAPESGGVYVFR